MFYEIDTFVPNFPQQRLNSFVPIICQFIILKIQDIWIKSHISVSHFFIYRFMLYYTWCPGTGPLILVKLIHSSSLHSISFSLWKHGAGFLCFYLWQWSVNTKNYWLFSFLYTMQLYSNLVMPNNKIFIIISHTCILRNNSRRNKMTFLWCWRITLPHHSDLIRLFT